MDEQPSSRIATPLGFDRLVERHLEPLRRYVRSRTGAVVRSKEPVSDIVQSVLREACEARRTQPGDEDSFRNWLFAVAANKIISKNRYYTAERRESAREDPLPEGAHAPRADEDACPSLHAERSEDLRRLGQELDRMDAEDRELLILRRIFGVPTPEIASMKGLAESTVRGRLGRIMADLALRLR